MNQLFYRAAEVSLPSYSEDQRTLEVAFSSEQPYPRSFGIEVLSHDPADIDMSWISSGRAPLLEEHCTDDQIGVVLSARLDPDKVCRAVVKFSQNDDGVEVLTDVLDGIKQNISVGYVITGRRIEEINGQQVVVCSWAPREISIVSIPADMTVGVGRSDEINKQTTASDVEVQAATSVEATDPEGQQKEQGQRAASITNNKNKDNKMENQNIDLDAVRSETVATERARIAELSALSTRHGVDATEFITSGKSVDAFRSHVLDTLASKPAVSTVASNSNIGLSDKEAKQFSLGRAVEAIVTGDWSEAGFELECSRAAAKAAGKYQTKDNIFVPGEYLARAAGANAVTAAGQPKLVRVTQRGFMDVLFDKTIAAQLGVTYMTGLEGTLKLPKVTSAATARFVGEGADGTIDNISSGEVVLQPRSLMAFNEITRSMLKNNGSIEGFLQAQLQKSIAIALDEDVFAKILADAGINWGTLTTLDFKALRELVKTVEVQNALSDSSKYAFNPIIGNVLSTTEKDSNTVGMYLRADDGSVAGYGAASSNTVGNNIIFGDFSQVAVGNWGTLELDLDKSQKFLSGGLVLRAMVDVDTAVLRPEAFSGYKAVI